ncbi:capping complex subunit for YIEGIA [Brevibacillus dissolubilis]|uniref:capping complex subunit for YIEGIA n=1 Tax=Brevibacillus dissolubilis TaxID=1844116 RepID=UPI0011170AAD|nr:hypothetical protein [Brevibacillus dissolubilis]
MAAQIMAIVTMEKENIAGGAPIFAVKSPDELQKTAFTLEKILDAMVHQINEKTLVIVRHR